MPLDDLTPDEAESRVARLSAVVLAAESLVEQRRCAAGEPLRALQWAARAGRRELERLAAG